MMSSSSCGEIGIEADGRVGSAIEDGFEDEAGGVAAEGQSAGGHFVEDHAEGKEIAASVEVFAAGLFGGHVGDGAERGAGAGEMLRGRLPTVVVASDFRDGGWRGWQFWRGRSRESWRCRAW